MDIEVVAEPPADLIRFIADRIEEFNLARWDVKERVSLAVVARDDSHTIIAGVTAKTFGDWLLIENLWVSEPLRGERIGSTILKALEAEARTRGCRYALLDTLDFQARPFYEKYGYALQWTQENYPRTGCKHFMTKVL